MSRDVHANSLSNWPDKSPWRANAVISTRYRCAFCPIHNRAQVKYEADDLQTQVLSVDTTGGCRDRFPAPVSALGRGPSIGEAGRAIPDSEPLSPVWICRSRLCPVGDSVGLSRSPTSTGPLGYGDLPVRAMPVQPRKKNTVGTFCRVRRFRTQW